MGGEDDLLMGTVGGEDGRVVDDGVERVLLQREEVQRSS